MSRIPSAAAPLLASALMLGTGGIVAAIALSDDAPRIPVTNGQGEASSKPAGASPTGDQAGGAAGPEAVRRADMSIAPVSLGSCSFSGEVSAQALPADTSAFRSFTGTYQKKEHRAAVRLALTSLAGVTTRSIQCIDATPLPATAKDAPDLSRSQEAPSSAPDAAVNTSQGSAEQGAPPAQGTVAPDTRSSGAAPGTTGTSDPAGDTDATGGSGTPDNTGGSGSCYVDWAPKMSLPDGAQLSANVNATYARRDQEAAVRAAVARLSGQPPAKVTCTYWVPPIGSCQVQLQPDPGAPVPEDATAYGSLGGDYTRADQVPGLRRALAAMAGLEPEDITCTDYPAPVDVPVEPMPIEPGAGGGAPSPGAGGATGR